VLLIFSVSSCTRVCFVCTGTWATRLTSTVRRLGDPKCRVSSIYLIFDIFVNCSWVGTRWQWYSTHLHTNNTWNNTVNNKTTRITNKTAQKTNLEECWPCPVFASFTLAFALQLREKLGKTSVRVAEEIQSIHIIGTPTNYKTHICSIGSQSVLRGSRGIRDKFLVIRGYISVSGYFEVYLFFNSSNNVLLKISLNVFNWRCVYFA
jgi:hypothetical protein